MTPVDERPDGWCKIVGNLISRFSHRLDELRFDRALIAENDVLQFAGREAGEVAVRRIVGRERTTDAKLFCESIETALCAVFFKGGDDRIRSRAQSQAGAGSSLRDRATIDRQRKKVGNS